LIEIKAEYLNSARPAWFYIFTIGPDGPVTQGWTTEAVAALAFHRREDAEAAAKILLAPDIVYKITQHLTIDDYYPGDGPNHMGA
jgi:hypothetical protein